MPDFAPTGSSLLGRPRAGGDPLAPRPAPLPTPATPPAPSPAPSPAPPPAPSAVAPRPSLLAQPRAAAGPAAPPPVAPLQAQKAEAIRRAFADPDAIRAAIYARALTAARSIKPLENQRHILEVVDPRYEGPETYSLAAQKKAILEGTSLDRRLRADVVLRDKATGAELSRKATTLAKVPFFTPRGTFIQNGVAYTLAHQFRLRGGAFTRRKQNGELEAHINVLPGKGFAHRVHLDHETGRFELGIGQGAVPLMPVLKALGASDDQLRAAWGDNLFAVNRRKDEPAVLKAIAAKVRGDDSLPAEEKLRAAFTGMALDPDVNRRTLGRPHAAATPDLYLDVTRKLLAINKGEAKPDDRDHLAYMTIHGPEDLIAERIERSRGALQRPFWKASLLGKLDRFPAEVLGDAVRSAIFQSGLGAPNEEVNPAMVLEQQGRVSRLGVGAIPSVDAVPDESRAVQPSFLGFVDPLVTPECFDERSEVLTRTGWKFWPTVTTEDRLACLVDGAVEYHTPEALHAGHYSGPMYAASSKFLEYMVTPNHRLWVRPHDKEGTSVWRFEEASRTHGRPRRFRCGGHDPYRGTGMTEFALPMHTKGSTNDKLVDRVAIGDWAELVGWYLSEGSHHFDQDASYYRILISQCLRANPGNCAELAELLDRLPFSWSYSGKSFAISTKQIASYFSQFGLCDEKFIPEELFDAPVEARRRMFFAMLKGDGRKHKSGEGWQCYCTTSRRLATDFERLAFDLGYSTRTTFEPDDREERYKGCWCVHVHKRNERTFTPTNPGFHGRYEVVEDFSGTVYCATVPGGLLYVRRGNSVGHWSGNSMRAGVDSRIANNVTKGEDGRLYAKLRDARTGAESHISAQDLQDKIVAFPGELRKERGRVVAISGGRIRRVKKEDVDYELPVFEDAFSPITNMVPMKSGVKGQRAVMAGRMITQALPLLDAEAPHVQSAADDDGLESYEERYGAHMGAVRSKAGGVVQVAEPGRIVVRHDDGTTQEHELHVHTPSNRKTGLHQTPTVQPGQRVEAGGLLAHSNYTDKNGTTALGKNFRVAYLPAEGANFEDAIAISESAARRLTSEHYYQNDLDHEDGVEVGRRAHISSFPGKYTKAVLGKLDDQGVIKVGETVKPGEPLTLAVQERPPGPGQIYGGKRRTWVDKSLVWDHPHEGIVTDVARTKSGVKVIVKSKAEMELADKLSGRYGDKGTIGKVIPDDEMPIGADGKPFEVLVNDLGVITRCYDEATEFMTRRGWVFGRDVRPDDEFVCFHPWTGGLHVLPQLDDFHVADYKGPMLAFANKVMDFCVTPNHRMWTKSTYPGAPWHEETASRIYQKEWYVPVAGLPVPGVESAFVVPHVDCHAKDTQSDRSEIALDAGDWAEFLGWYMAEGNVDDKVHISQSQAANPEKCERIGALLTRLGFRWNYNPKNTQFHFSHKRVAAYLAQFGDRAQKFIPDWLFAQPPAIRQLFLDAYWQGDGSVRATKAGSRVSTATSTSERLVDDVQRLHVYQGMSASKSPMTVKSHHSPAWACGRHYRAQRQLEAHNWSKVNYDGKIYCPTVATGYVVTRRNGKVLIAGNTNPAQVAEAWLGKIAALTGKPYKMADFRGKKLIQFALDELKKHGLSDTEDIVDPRSGAKIPGVLTGNRFFMKLHHTAESKGQGRGLAGYTAEGMPAKGGPEGAKRVSLLDANAILSSGATAVLRDAGAVRGQAQPEMWLRFMAGHALPEPKVPLVYEKFFESLKAAGVNPVREGPRTHLMALTDKDVDELAGDRELTSGETVDWEDSQKPIKGGLFDPGATGGPGGRRWTKITLPEPMPNPAFEEPIRRVLGLTGKQFEEVVAGERELQGLKGPGAIATALGRIDLDDAVVRARREVQNGRGARRDAAVRSLGYLKAAQRVGIHPREWMMTKVPVLPPLFRPVSMLQGSKTPLVSDPNHLYKELLEAKDNHKALMDATDDLAVERRATYGAMKAVVGLGEPIGAKSRERGVAGILKTIFGPGGPKTGFVQRKLLGTQTDLVGRAVIAPDADLDMDSVGLPEDRAWSVYRPFIVRRLVRAGVPRVRAVQMIEDKDNQARKAMLTEMEDRPVILNRAPVLHRYGVMAFRPRLVKGSAMTLSPLVVKGFNADFDGDAMQYHVPAADDAVKEAYEKMMPSRNLLSVNSFQPHMLPVNEFAGGLYIATSRRKDGDPVRTFQTHSDAVRAYRSGEITIDTPVRILQDDEG